MPTVTHDLVVKTGTYTDRTTGEIKNRYKNIGFVMKHDDGGSSIKLECLPVGVPNWDGWVSVFKKDDQNVTGGQQRGNRPAQRQQQATPQRDPGMDDDIPF
ncbi:MAG: hypothetical protein WCP34_16225 [Pseudomonadota bacterium]